MGLNTESCDNENNTALHWAINKRNVNAVKCLLEHGASIEAQNDNGDTPLNYAVSQGNMDIVELLLQKNANINAKNKNGLTALDIAVTKNPELINPILIHMTTLPAKQQAEYLLASKNPELFKRLLALTLSNKKNAVASDIQDELARMHFDTHLEQIYLNYQQMQEKSQTNTDNKAATPVAKQLLLECFLARATLIQGKADNFDSKITEFKSTCKKSINNATPVLKKHREWGKVIAALLLALVTLPVSATLCVTGFISFKTKSKKLLDQLKTGLDKPDNPGPRGA